MRLIRSTLVHMFPALQDDRFASINILHTLIEHFFGKGYKVNEVYIEEIVHETIIYHYFWLLKSITCTQYPLMKPGSSIRQSWRAYLRALTHLSLWCKNDSMRCWLTICLFFWLQQLMRLSIFPHTNLWSTESLWSVLHNNRKLPRHLLEI